MDYCIYPSSNTINTVTTNPNFNFNSEFRFFKIMYKVYKLTKKHFNNVNRNILCYKLTKTGLSSNMMNNLKLIFKKVFCFVSKWV